MLVSSENLYKFVSYFKGRNTADKKAFILIPFLFAGIFFKRHLFSTLYIFECAIPILFHILPFKYPLFHKFILILMYI